MPIVTGTIYDDLGVPAAGRVVLLHRRDTGAVIGRMPTSDGSSRQATTNGLLLSLDAAAYSGGQVWENEVYSPADLSPPTSYNWLLGGGTGSEASDPTAMNVGADGAYFSLDGGDYFTHSLPAAAMPEFLRAMHKAGSQFTIEIWMQWAGTTGPYQQPLFDSGSSDQGGSDMSRGVLFGDLGSSSYGGGKINLRIKRDGGASTAFSRVADSQIPANSMQMIAVSYDGTGAEPSFFYRNGDYDPSEGASTWVANGTSFGTLDATMPARIGARGDAFAKVPSGTRIYVIRLYNRPLSKSELDENWVATGARYGLSNAAGLPVGQYSIRTNYVGEAYRVVLDDDAGVLHNDLIDRVMLA